MTEQENGAATIEDGLDELTPEQQAEFEQLLAALTAPQPNAEVDARYQALIELANGAGEKLSDEVDAGQEREYSLTVSSSELRALLSGVGFFVNNVAVFAPAEVGHKSLDAADVVIDTALHG